MPEHHYDNVLCCLDRSPADIRILEFTAQLQDANLIKHVKLLHVLTNELEDQARQYTDNNTWTSFKQDIRNAILADCKSIFKNPGEIEIIVKGGSALEVINAKSKSESADLIIVGKKRKNDGLGIASHHIARSSICDVLFVPDMDFGKPESALVGYDFSEHAEFTLQIAEHIAGKLGVKFIKTLNVLASPVGYFKSGRLHKEFLDTEKKKVLKRWNKEVELHPKYKDFHFEIMVNEKNDIAHYLIGEINQLPKCMIFLGSKGKTASSAFLLGSVTEKLLMHELDCPVWIHKMQGENFDLFDALFKGE